MPHFLQNMHCLMHNMPLIEYRNLYCHMHNFKQNMHYFLQNMHYFWQNVFITICIDAFGLHSNFFAWKLFKFLLPLPNKPLITFRQSWISFFFSLSLSCTWYHATHKRSIFISISYSITHTSHLTKVNSIQLEEISNRSTHSIYRTMDCGQWNV